MNETEYKQLLEQIEKIDISKTPNDLRTWDPDFDPELTEILKEIQLVKAPNSLTDRVIRTYRWQNRLEKSLLAKTPLRTIILNKSFIKKTANLQGLEDLLHQYIPGKIDSNFNLFQPIFVLATTLFLIVTGIITYYSFYNTNKLEINPIVSNPTISTPSPVIHSIATPSPTSSTNITDNNKDEVAIYKSNKDNSTIEEVSKEKNNHKQKQHDSQKPVDISQTRSLESTNDNNTNSTFSSMHNIYLGDLLDPDNPDEWMTEFSNQLKIKIQTENYWVVVDESEKDKAELDFKITKDKHFVLVSLTNKSDKPLWSSKKFKLGEGNPKEVANIVVEELIKKMKHN
jgi:hypothetical protein